MKQFLTPLFFMILILAACGDSTSEVGTGAQGDDPAPAGDPIPDLPLSDDDDEIITDDQPFDGKITTPTEVLVNPDDPSELWVRFVGGAAPCTAAHVTVLTETPDEVVIELVVGITSDALMKSCLAGEFNLRVDVALNEPATGKNLSWAQAEPAGNEAIQVTPDLTTDDFVGLTEAEATAIAEENMSAYRVVRVDGEWFPVTQDFNPGRLNFEVDDGVITAVTLG